MIAFLGRSATFSWLLLLAISAAGFFSAEYLPLRPLAIVLICVIAVVKVAVIMRFFMRVDKAPFGVSAYLAGWATLCGVGIAVRWFAAR